MLTKNNLKYFNVSLKTLRQVNPNISIHFRLKYPNKKDYCKLKPSSRITKIDSIYRNNYKLLQRQLKVKCKSTGTHKRPSGLRCVLRFSDIESLDCKKIIEHTVIEKIEGYQKRKSKKRKIFISIKVRIIIQVEGYTTGKQTYEDRIIIVKAKSTKSAKKKVIKGLKKDSKPYLNSDGRLVRWKFEKIVDVYETYFDKSKELNDKFGAEVFSVLNSRKLSQKNIYPSKWKQRN